MVTISKAKAGIASTITLFLSGSYFQYLLVLLLFIAAMFLMKGKKKKVYLGGLFYAYFISFLTISSNFLLISWLQVVALMVGAEDGNELVLYIWVWSLLAMTLLSILPRAKKARNERRSRGVMY